MNRRFALKSIAALGFATALSACATTGGDDIVDVASSNSDFSTLVAAVSAAGLVDTLKGPGPFTVFAPTNEAFAALPDGTVETLLLPENKDQLVKILTYHVVPGSYPASALAGEKGSLTTAEGQKLRVDGTDGVKINNANVIAADVFASNGIIHAIDTVLLPK